MFGQEKPQDNEIFTALDRLVVRIQHIEARLKALEQKPAGRIQSQVEQWLPVIDRFQEMALVAQGHPDLAQSFGLASRQKANEPEPPATEWTGPDEPEGVTYG